MLEKILEEIEEATRQEDAPIYCGNMEVDGYVRMSVVEEIVRKHMENDGWIPVEKGLPEENDGDYYDTVIVTLSNGRVAPAVYRNYNDEWWVENEDGKKAYTHSNEVIAWQPLPEPYRTERSEENA